MAEEENRKQDGCEQEDAYLREKRKNADLAERLAFLEEKNEELQYKLDRIKKNPMWKASAPLRSVLHFGIRQRDRLKNQGSIRGVLRKLSSKAKEKQAMKRYGSASFPDAEEREAQRREVFANPVTISILTPLYNTPERFLRDMIESVVQQTYANWQLCLADGSDKAHAYVEQVVKEYADADARIVYQRLEQNLGISGNTNACLSLAEGSYIGLLDHDDILHPEVLYDYVKVINEEGADYLYCDETTFSGNSIDHMLTMHFKPDYAIDNLRANNYICHFSVFHRDLLQGEELFRSKFDGSQDHDMILRLTDRAKKIVHVPKLLYYWRSHAGSTAQDIGAKSYAIEAARGAVADHLRRHGFRHFKITSTRAFETIFKISYEILGDPKISIVIPNKDHTQDLRRCIDSIFAKTTYENVEVVVVENGSLTPEIFRYYEELKQKPYADCVKVVSYQRAEGEAFNFSRVVNFGVSQTSGDFLVLLNNDVEIITVNWLEELLMYAQRKDVGAVGGKLYFPDRTIQHAGVILGLGAHRTAGHAHYGMSRQNLGYMGRLCYAQDMSAVTGACLMVAKAKFEEVGGFDPSFAVSLNDVDFCLKLRAKNYLNVFTPFCEAYHYESASRGDDLTGENARRYNEESAHFRKRYKEVLQKGDPYYNPNFTLDKSDFSLRME
ncbi:MAG: glycosyltransferase [Lachnospiraceae bacterium]|nr:glycosyltransferase [Lachnospiraceae bacterium]